MTCNLDAKQTEALRRELDACRKAGEVVRRALLEDIEGLAADLAKSEEERVRIASLIEIDAANPSSLDDIERRGVNTFFHEEDRAEILRRVGPVVRARGRASQADTIALFVSLQDADERLSRVEMERRERETEIAELRASVENAEHELSASEKYGDEQRNRAKSAERERDAHKSQVSRLERALDALSGGAP